MILPEVKKTSTRAATGAGVVFIAQLVGYGLYFFAQRLILSEMSKEEFGSLVFIQQMCSVVMVTLVDAGMNNIAMREMIAMPGRKGSIVSVSLWLRIITTVISAVLLTLFFTWHSGDPWLTILVAVAMISLNGRSAMLRSSLELPFRENLQLTLVSLLFVVDLAVYVALLHVYRSSLTTLTIFTLQLVSTLPGFVVLAWRVRLPSLLFPVPGAQQFRDLLREVRPAMSQLVAQNVHSAIDLLVLKFYAPLRAMGVFGAVANMGTIILTMYTALSMTLYPLVSESIHSPIGNARYRVERTLMLILFISVLLAALLSALAPLVILLFTKNAYADTVTEFQLQFWCAVAINVSQCTMIINAANKQHSAMLLSGVGLVVGSLSADFVLIPWFHTAGMLVAKSWSNVVSAAISLGFIAMSFGKDLVWRFVWKSSVLCLCTLPVSLIALDYVDMYSAALIVGILCCGMGWLLGIISTDDVKIIRAVWHSVTRRGKFKSNVQD